jgi:Holliday junction DNA helicase RuvA
LTPEEVEMFRLLISVSHVGPHTGLAIMSRFSVSDICDAILSKRSDVLSQVQGLGKKGADRIILELQKKVAEFKTNASISEPTASPIQDSVLALIALGYTREEATQAIEKISSLHGTVSSPEMVKEALVYLRKK